MSGERRPENERGIWAPPSDFVSRPERGRGVTTRRRWLLGAVVLGSLGCGSGDDGPGPRIDLVAPPVARSGDTVDVLGERFCGVSGADGGACQGGFVTFGANPGFDPARVASWSDTRITVVVPGREPGPTSVVVTVLGRQSNVVDFAVSE